MKFRSNQIFMTCHYSFLFFVKRFSRWHFGKDSVLLIDTGEEDTDGLLDEKTANCVNQKFEKENQLRKILKSSGLTLVEFCHQVLQLPFSIFEYFKIRFDRGVISLS